MTILFFQIALKDIFATRDDLPISVNDRIILPFCEDFIFRKLRILRSFTKIKPSRKFPNLQYSTQFWSF